MNIDLNILARKNFRTENIIKHPDEVYVEVSVRSVLKIRNCANKAKCKCMRNFCGCMYATFLTCVGALLGYLPDIYDMFQKSSFSDFSIIYIFVTMICFLSCLIWLFLRGKIKDIETSLITTIEEELSEDRVPVNHTFLKPDMYPSNNVEYRPVVKGGV